ncbi:hypothetical protein F3Y22_tig00116962pilonHSYRG00080 [Hibiscus syriacus]|uniref:Uncharacterized protein n=1 Tax=Hibiscus syriacus TaxID=106335 RepID=A0A6A2WIW3_HIBSY|nr:hypothetical protein F3Y22_tig00116962pilonHSYRG00080 [Hibiscus syriacus]
MSYGDQKTWKTVGGIDRKIGEWDDKRLYPWRAVFCPAGHPYVALHFDVGRPNVLPTQQPHHHYQPFDPVTRTTRHDDDESFWEWSIEEVKQLLFPCWVEKKMMK